MPTYFPVSFEAATLEPMTDLDAKVSFRHVGRLIVLDLDGPLAGQRVTEELRNHVRELLEAGTRHFAINLLEVPYVDSAGVGALIASRLAIRAAGGKLTLLSAHPRILDTLKRLRVDSFFEFSDNQAAA